MRRLYIIGLLLLSTLFYSKVANASHSMGVDISYKHIFGNTYQITLSFYRDCSGISAPTSVSIDIASASACGATSAVIGDNLSAATSQVVFHIPVTANKAGVQHVGSNIIFFNTANNQYLTLKNPVIDLAKGVVSATVPQAGDAKVDILTITNASTAKPKITNDKKAKQRTTAYTGTTLVLAPGVAATIASVLGLPAGSLPDGLAFGTADVTLYSKLK